MSEVAEKTLGEQRVRTSFNVTNDDTVTHLKNKTAELIDLLQSARNTAAVSGPDGESPAQYQQRCGEQNRLIALAQTTYEEAAMWAVKAATANK